MTPPYRLWVDGSYYMGMIGYGIVSRPGDVLRCGGQAGADSHQAELLGAAKALETIPDGEACILYTDSLPVIAFYAATPPRRIRLTVSQIKGSHPQHKIAHELANRGRAAAYRASRDQA